VGWRRRLAVARAVEGLAVRSGRDPKRAGRAPEFGIALGRNILSSSLICEEHGRSVEMFTRGELVSASSGDRETRRPRSGVCPSGRPRWETGGVLSKQGKGAREGTGGGSWEWSQK